MKHMVNTGGFGPSRLQELKMSIMKQSYCKQYSYYIAIFGSNYNTKMQLHAYYRLNLVQPLTLSNGDRSSYFTMILILCILMHRNIY